MIYLFYGIHVLICLFLILVVLLQQGKGADLSVFGGGGTMTAFGARGATTLLHKLTVYAFIGFIVTTLGIGILQSYQSTSSVMNVVEDEATGADEAAGETGVEAGTRTAPQDAPEGVFSEPEEAGGESAADGAATAGEGDEGAASTDPAGEGDNPAGAGDDPAGNDSE